MVLCCLSGAYLDRACFVVLSVCHGVVYFHQLSGAARTWKLVKIHNSHGMWCSFVKKNLIVLSGGAVCKLEGQAKGQVVLGTDGV